LARRRQVREGSSCDVAVSAKPIDPKARTASKNLHAFADAADGAAFENEYRTIAAPDGDSAPHAVSALPAADLLGPAGIPVSERRKTEAYRLTGGKKKRLQRCLTRAANLFRNSLDRIFNPPYI